MVEGSAMNRLLIKLWPIPWEDSASRYRAKVKFDGCVKAVHQPVEEMSVLGLNELTRSPNVGTSQIKQIRSTIACRSTRLATWLILPLDVILSVRARSRIPVVMLPPDGQIHEY